jgi:hypothetical protein
MFRPGLLVSLVLLAFSATAGDVPLSDRRLAPLPGLNVVTAAASPEAVLVVFPSASTVFAQRLDLQGRPLDATAFPIAPASGARVIWDGSKWLVFLGGPPVRIAHVHPTGDFDGPFELTLDNFADVAFVDGRVIVASREYVSAAGARIQLHELLQDGSLVPGLETVIDDPRGNWVVGLDGGAGLVTHQHVWGTSPFLSARFKAFTPGGINELTVPVTSGAPNIQFVSSSDGGGLLLWNDGGMRGAILRRDSTFSEPFAIGPAEVAYEGVRAAARADGWDVLFAPGGKTWIAGVAHSGQVDARPIELERAFFTPWNAFLAVGPSQHLLIGARGEPAGGIAVRRIVAGAVEPPFTIGLGEAAQYGVRSAEGGGLDLVVWNEQSMDGRVLRAARIGAAGTPLDGAGLLVTSDPLPAWGYDEHFDVAFDGRAFVVVWLTAADEPRVVMRTISTDGVMSAPVVLATWRAIAGVSAAGAGAGGSAIAWFGRELKSGGYRSVLVPLVDGESGAMVEVGSGMLGQSLPQLAANGDRYLAVFNDFTDCRITCTPSVQPYGRMFAFDGTPLTEARRLTSGIGSSPQVVSDGTEFFVTWQDILVSVGADFTIGPERTLARGGDLSIEGTEVRVDHGIVRSVYSLSGDLLRFEPLHIAKGENRSAALSRDRIVVAVPADPARLFIRFLGDPPAAIADLAIVATGAVLPGYYGAAHATFRVEHRGGAPVSRIELWSSLPVSEPGDPSPGWTPTLTLDRELREGESFEVLLRVYPESANPPLWVAGDVLDPVPANNVDRYERPVRPRGRLVGR